MRLTRTPSSHRSSNPFSISGRTALILGLASQMILLVFCFLFSKSSVVEEVATYIYADAQADYLWGVFVGLLLTVTVSFWPIDAREKLVVALLWQAKVVICLVLMLFYEAYFIELDAFGYFNTAVSEFAQFDGLLIGDGSNNVTEICKLLLAILPGSYHMLKVLFAYAGLIGIFFFYRTICLASGTSNTMWLIGLGLFPSILFWSSILGKDPLSFLGIALSCYGIINISKKQLTVGIFSLAAGILLVAYIRIWMSLILLAPAALVIALTVKSRLARILLAVLALGVAAGLLSVFNERFEIESRKDAVERYDALSRNWSDVGGSSQAIEANLTDPIQMLAFVPMASFTALFRPLPFEITSVFGTISGLENLLLLVMFWRALMRFRMHHFRDHAIAVGILFIGVWVLIYGPISYQNFGTAVRFKLQVLPVFLALLIAIGSKRAPGGEFSESAQSQPLSFDPLVNHKK
jgi:hypothetical protein